MQFDFSLIFPGQTALTFGDSQKNDVCEKLASQSLPPNTKPVCTIGSVTTLNGTSAVVNGYYFYEWIQDPTASQLQLVSAIRDAKVQALRSNTASVFSPTFNGVYSNCACKELVTVTDSYTSPFSYNTNLTGIPGPVQCGAKLIYNTAVANANINVVGVDDGSVNAGNLGKYCSDPAVEGGVLGTPGAGSCRQYGIIASASGTSQATATSAMPTTGVIQTGMISVTQQGSGYTSVPTVTISAPNPSPATVAITLSGASPTSVAPTSASNGPYSARPTGTIGGGDCVDAGAGAGKCSGPSKTIQDYQGQTRTGTSCTTADFNSPTGCSGSNCVTWAVGVSNQAVTAVRFPGSNPANVYCTFPPTISLDNTFLQAPVQAQAIVQLSGSKVSNIVVNSPGNGYRTAPTITIGVPESNDLGKLCSPNPVTLPTNIAVNTPIPGGITSLGQCQPLGRDTQFGKVCSVPAAPNGGVWSNLNQGTCNVESSFRNQPTPTDTYKCGILSQSFVTQVIPGPPPPSPVPVPSPPPSPAPVPSPSPSPVPSPPPSPAPVPSPPPSPAPVPSPPSPLVCTYKGLYRISPLTGSCKNYYLASGTSSNCKNTAVKLRKSYQVKPKYSRIKWELDTQSTENKGKAGRVMASAMDKCKSKYLAAPSDPTNLKLGGNAWKWQVVPRPDANKCDEVNLISQNRLSKSAYLQVSSSCKSFGWASEDGTAQRFKLRKA